ncbi:MAG: dTDP-4-dehydrorhamnose 3,5-epimerase [Cytophagales bacterium]|nr:MAG: dTDP-4-dehydrorhamnose 3,5-epimerase [Cytophagales bacterium]
MNDWLLEGTLRDGQSITSDWQPAHRSPIEGVEVIDVQNVIKNNGYLTEICRSSWLGENTVVDQVFQVALWPGGLSAWHTHEHTTDRLFVTLGTLKIVLYDARSDSSTFGQINEFRVSHVRPQLIVVPPKVYHGVQNIGPDTALLLNMVDRAYQYESPDHYRLDPATDQIPYRF